MLASKDADIQRLKTEADTARRETIVLRQQQGALYTEIESLKDVQRQLREEMDRREAHYQEQVKAKQGEDSLGWKEVDRLKEELVRPM